MKNKFSFLLPRLKLVAGFAALLLTIPLTGGAQETTSNMRGTVTAPDGSPAAGAVVSVTDTRTGTRRGSSTSPSGTFSMSGLAVGGPYTINITSTAYTDQEITDIYLSLGETFTFSIALGEAELDVITVTAEAIETAQVAVGPSSTFNLAELESAPAINRDLKDVIRIDPRVYVDEAFVDSVVCVGANPRFNSLTVDGVKMNDNFGLNSNGYPGQRMPFPYDSIQNVSLELAPYDVQYSGFTACNVNAVTKSGTNEFHGRVFYDYTSDSFEGDELEGTRIPRPDFDEKRFGFSLGGPIIADKLFFFASYAKAETADNFDRCAGDQSCGVPVLGVSQAQVDRIANIARTLYNYDPGDPISSSPNEDEKYLVKLDWNINDSHRAALTYNFNDGFNLTESDGDANEFEFSNHFYERGAELNNYVAQLYSDWNENFSTEVRVGYSKLDNRQLTRGGVGMGEIRIETYFNGQRANVYLGGDDSRQSNKLKYDTTNVKLAGTYTLGDHVISGGYEQEEIDIFNLFLQHTVGEYRFDEQCFPGNDSGCIDAFEDFSPDDIYYGNAAGSNNPSDAAALFAYRVHSLYLQDEFTFSNTDLTIVAGLRYDWFDSDDLPAENQRFINRTGFTNRKNFDGEGLIQPRFGFTWDVNDSLTLRGGFGLYSGGNPNVWLGNNYQNDGFTQVQFRESDFDTTIPDGMGGFLRLRDINGPLFNLTDIPLGASGTGSPIFDAPQVMIDGVATGTGNSSVNAIAPGFEIPSNWKFSIGGTYNFDLPGGWGDGYVLSGDLLLTRGDNSVFVRDDTFVQISTAPDGRPVYWPTDKEPPGCAADPRANLFGCDRLFTGDFILDNVQGDDLEQTSVSLTLSKAYDWGLDWTFGYAYTESEDVSPMTSSVAFSNWIFVSTADYNNPGLATSDYEIPNRFILKVGFEREFFGDYTTRFTLYGSRNEGRPFSYTFDEQEMFVQGSFANPDDDRSLLYMPSGPSDPLVVFDPGFDQAAFFAFAAANGIPQCGCILGRNGFNSNWWSKFDLRISQDIPGFNREHRVQAYLIVENLGNFLNDDWGVFYERDFPRRANIVSASLLDTAGTPGDFSDDQYLFQNFIPQTQTRVTNVSLWAARIGINYRF
ncbi:MAG: carboxypeptidase regulatory-like domain-containing protein [Woeseia sp.]